MSNDIDPTVERVPMSARLLDKREFTKDQLLLTTTEAARVLSVGRTTVYALIERRELRPVHLGRSCRISRGELERFIKRLESRTASQPD